ncbi:hypothetical protein IGI04_013406 [Brassica rapa subsp. trilocularis]|uniref:Uncharacterized protein n=1 Tax=Brassica rapa subsp. trilocularis TaxID=1813537 RepID=A0ABQ7N8Q9_BRACM|nr:hypothetical protein IGI04_013406 [Brassica rapa subsp. trilocularis]
MAIRVLKTISHLPSYGLERRWSSAIKRLAAPPPPFNFVCSVPGGQECTPWCSMANVSVFL